MELSEIRSLYDMFNGDRVCVEMAIQSINDNTVSLCDIEGDDYFLYGNKYYSSDEYIVDYSGNVIDLDYAGNCDVTGETFHVDDLIRVNDGGDDVYFCQSAIDNGRRGVEWVQCRGEYVTEHGIHHLDLVWCEDVEEYMHMDDCYERHGCWYANCPEDEYTRDYHTGGHKTKMFNGTSKWKIGYEIEKEDEDVKESINIDEFEDVTDDLWKKEKDSSLCGSSGYELISPTFELNIEKIFKHIEGNKTLVNHINAHFSTSCGGHIHLSKDGLSGEELFDKIKGYTPLFYALYHGRVDRSYCKGKNNRDLKNENEKYQAIKIHYDRVEFRIISAVPNVTTLKWRTRLISMITRTLTDDVRVAYYNVDTKFTKLLREVYDDDKLALLKERFVKYTRQFEGLDIK